ncbi:hypothetical protein PFISCL1PPCAC_22060, partial [Pristionchus fissidentatus]
QVSSSKDTHMQFAAKTEMFHRDDKGNRLKVEIAVFEDIAACVSPVDKSHFVQLIDSGKSATLKFIVMELIGSSVYDLPRTGEELGLKHTRGTIMRIARQSLQAIEALHIIGYIHRDIKPHNFAVGVPPNETKVYLIDFGIARRIYDEKHRIRILRKLVNFVGTPRYASRACHKKTEQSRKDDLESWIYMLFELFNINYLTWHAAKTRDGACYYKEQFMTQPPEFKRVYDAITENQLFALTDIVNQTSITSTPDYLAMHRVLDSFCKDNNIDERQIPDWVKSSIKPSPKPVRKKVKARLEDDNISAERRARAVRAAKLEAILDERMRQEDFMTKVYMEVDKEVNKDEARVIVRRRMREDRLRLAKEAKEKRRAENRETYEDEEELEDEESDRADVADLVPHPVSHKRSKDSDRRSKDSRKSKKSPNKSAASGKASLVVKNMGSPALTPPSLRTAKSIRQNAVAKE